MEKNLSQPKFGKKSKKTNQKWQKIVKYVKIELN